MELISRNLRVFDRVADSCSFVEVARDTYVSQTAVSKAVKSLEDELGVKLFVRDKRNGTRLSPEGEQVLTTVRELLRTEADLYRITKRNDSKGL